MNKAIKKTAKRRPYRLNAIVIGAGLPGRSIGWLHLEQLLGMESVRTRHIVEPWWLDKKNIDTQGGREFYAACEKLQLRQKGISLHSSAKHLPDLPADEPWLAIIAARTHEAPALFKTVIEKGVRRVYLEKPGAQNADELKEMIKTADDNGVAVVVGYQKTTAGYVRKAWNAYSEAPDDVIDLKFEHHNPHNRKELETIFRANMEGMLLNQCGHELALWVKKWGITRESIVDVRVHGEHTRLERFGDIRDFSELAFTALTSHGVNFTLVASRCGGVESGVRLKKRSSGEEKVFWQADEKTKKKAERVLSESPNTVWYYPFFESDYLRLKQNFIDHILAGESGIPRNAPSLKDAARALDIAESLLPTLLAQADETGQWTHYHAKNGPTVRAMDRLPSASDIMRWGILGCGKIANDFALALKAVPNSTLTAVAARNAGRAKYFASMHGAGASYGDYSRLAGDPNVDVIYVATIPELHRRHAELALRAGKHVLVEKPLATSIQDAEAIERMAKAGKKFCMEGMWTRFFPAVELARRLVHEGRIGKIRHVRADFGFDLFAEEGSRDAKWAAGAGMNVGVYPAHAAVMILGPEPVKMGAAGITDHLGYDMDAEGVLYAEFSKMRTASIHWSHLVDTPEDIYIFGEKGTIRLRPPAHAPTKITLSIPDGRRRDARAGLSDTWEFPLPVIKGDFFYPHSEGLCYEAAAVRRCILAGLSECPQSPLSESVSALKMVLNGVSEIRRRRAAPIKADISLNSNTAGEKPCR
ncbi:putative Trans-1,2-dihydrobenzene-1,2-diol dehydrogenase [Candidatus Desulfarcum epimagneticum]|uniref:Putative Trans-1,2-dihydrobenzene-1,2-diol dehydrogenase n=1 Tax=uncultured Desulfobacteraceae bacterium TaxID=218296 RepID=A0A484HHL1_9BACT|nr:putative Trans-1,2-dihydrobenzene-1,2-diol dehydrogenase [uncultured Desulfobacteraceae bacterium]